MKPRFVNILWPVLGLLLGLTVSSGHAQAPLGTSFTYQGRLTDGGAPANGLYDLTFALYDDPTAGAQVGGTVTKDDVSVSDGMFTVALDFGNVFDGTALYLEIGVRPGSDTGAYTTLTPRQPLTAAPYAGYALRAPWSGLTGVPAGFADGVDNDTTYTAGDGLTLAGAQFSVNFAGTGSANTAARSDHNHNSTYWSLTGNGGTNPGTHFVGTTDNQALEFKVNSQRALRLEPNATSPNLIGGYSGNSVTSGVVGATIGGGGDSLNPNRVTDNYGTVGGGYNNRAGDSAGTTSDSAYATAGGGRSNTASNLYATVGGGYNNAANGGASTIGGGLSNATSDSYTTVSGGGYNTASVYASTVAGGYGNTADGLYATVGGGRDNTAAGSYSFVVGRRAKNAYSGHSGVFLFADGNNFDFPSTAANQFRVRATGGAQFVLGIDGSGNPTWSCAVSNGGSWACSSDRNLKENLALADGRAILETLSRLPLYTWSAKGGDPSVRHLGPMAQDFYAAFRLGDSDVAISTIDLDGVSLAAIQGLYGLVQEQDARIAELEAQNADQQAQIDALEARLAALEQGRTAPANHFPTTLLLPGVGLLAAAGWRWKQNSRRAEKSLRNLDGGER